MVSNRYSKSKFSLEMFRSFHFISFHFIWSLITHFRINNELQCVYIQSEI